MAQESGTYNKSIVITKSDTVNFDGSTYAANAATKAIPADAIFVGGAGVVVAIFENGSLAPFTVLAGTVLPLKCIRVNSTSTTATLMNALYQV
jgi:hypothetical protein|tara:strand:- start:2640 stop:2918 length:279 start_codon:yes stop_codon:yes gene_type:complete